MKRPIRNLTSRRSGLIAGGNWIVDHVKVIDSWPPQDALASIVGQATGNGGSAYNVLKNLSRLGASFPLEGIGLVGRDADGQAILRDCREHGIIMRQLRATSQAATSFTDVMTVRDTGRRTFFHQRGANALLDVDDFDFGRSRARIFHLGYLLLLDRLDGTAADGNSRAGLVLQAARAAGLKTSIDVVSENSSRFRRVIQPVLPHVDYFFANDFEAGRLTSIRLRDRGRIRVPAVRQAGRRLLADGVREWVVLHFPEAVYACQSGGTEVWQSSVQVPPAAIKGAAGAGDALAAGVLLGLHEDWPMEKALRLGVCAAAASLLDVSCSNGVPRAAQALARGRRLGFKRSLARFK